MKCPVTGWLPGSPPALLPAVPSPCVQRAQATAAAPHAVVSRGAAVPSFVEQFSFHLVPVGFTLKWNLTTGYPVPPCETLCGDCHSLANPSMLAFYW